MSPEMAFDGRSHQVCPLLKVNQTRHRATVTAHIDPMYGPAVRSKKISTIRRWRSCINVSDLWLERRAPGHHGYQRACELINGQAAAGPFGSPGFACAGKTEPPSRL